MTPQPVDYTCAVCKGRFTYREGFVYRHRFSCVACGRRQAAARTWPVLAGIATLAVIAAAAWVAGVFEGAAPAREVRMAADAPAGLTGQAPGRQRLQALALIDPPGRDGRVFTTTRSFRLRGTAPADPLLVEHAGATTRAAVDAAGGFDVEVVLAADAGERITLRSGDSPPLAFDVVLDAAPPAIEVVYPQRQQCRTREATIDLVVRVEEANLARVAVGDRPFVRSPDGRWVLAFVPVANAGETKLVVEATDLAGNRGEAEVRCIVDDTGPRLTSSAPAAGTPLVICRPVAVELVYDEDLHSASLNGQALTVDGRRARGSVEWPRVVGAWRPRLVATDPLGNVTEETLTFTFVDGVIALTAPILTDGRIVSRQSTLRLVGTAPTASLRLERARTTSEIPVAGDGSFAVEITDLSGAGEEVVLRSDLAPEPLTFTLAVDTSPPVIELVAPREANLRTTQSRIELVVRVREANPGLVTLGERAFERRDDETWALTHTLTDDGESSFRIVATDLAGNRAETAVRCVRDTKGPKLTRSDPAAGSELAGAGVVAFALAFDEEVHSVVLAGVQLTTTGTLASGRVPRPGRPGTWEPVLEARDAAGNTTRTTLSLRVAEAALSTDLVGVWRDLETETLHAIEANGGTLRVASIRHPDREEYKVTASEWDGRVLRWRYQVPSTGYTVELVTQRIEGDTLWCTWSGTAGQGAQEFRRVVENGPNPRPANDAAATSPARYRSFDCLIVHTAGRKADATRANQLLTAAGFSVRLNQTSVSGNAGLRGRVFAHATEQPLAQEVVRLLASVETLHAADGGQRWAGFGVKSIRVWLID